MAKIDVLEMMYSKGKSPLEFHFENLRARPLLSLLTVYDIESLRRIATSIKLSSKPEEKYKMIDQIMRPRGFKFMSSGTNRVVYKYLDDNTIVVKIAIDKVGMKDNPAEYRNQYLLEPFVTKVFEVSPCGTVGLFERVNPITSREEYLSIADSVYELLTTITGKYVLNDIGTMYFQNIGIRTGFGVVLLDFPYCYELDNKKLYCNKVDLATGIVCGGEIDYDSGFNKLICTKCGKEYYAKQLEKYRKEKKIIVETEGEKDMKISIVQNKKVIKTFKEEKNTNTIPVKKEKKPNISVSGQKPNRPKPQMKKEASTVTENKPVNTPSANANISSSDYKSDSEDKVIYQQDEKAEEIDAIQIEKTVVDEGQDSNIPTDVTGAY